MNKGYNRQYYVKKLYLSAGRTVADYCFDRYKNAPDTSAVLRYIADISARQECIPCCDIFSRRNSIAFEYFIKMHKNTGNMFVYIDDLSAADRIMAVYTSESRKFIYSASHGSDMVRFYRWTDSADKEKIKLAWEYFCRCGEYCQSKDDVL